MLGFDVEEYPCLLTDTNFESCFFPPLPPPTTEGGGRSAQLAQVTSNKCQQNESVLISNLGINPRLKRFCKIIDLFKIVYVESDAESETVCFNSTGAGAGASASTSTIRGRGNRSAGLGRGGNNTITKDITRDSGRTRTIPVTKKTTAQVAHSSRPSRSDRTDPVSVPPLQLSHVNRESAKANEPKSKHIRKPISGMTTTDSELLSTRAKYFESLRRFYIVAIQEMLSRFDFSDSIYSISELLRPTNARSLNQQNLSPLFKRFPILRNVCDPRQAEDEWRSHASYLTVQNFGLVKESDFEDIDVSKYWKIVLSMKTPTGGALMFPNLAKCMSLLLSLPSSNVLAERVFSQLKLIKTDHRNRLDSLSCSSLLKVKFWLKLSGCTPSSVDISDELLKHAKKVKANALIAKK